MFSPDGGRLCVVFRLDPFRSCTTSRAAVAGARCGWPARTGSAAS
jgi:hypothetical protein